MITTLATLLIILGAIFETLHVLPGLKMWTGIN